MWLEGDELVYLLETHHQGIEPKECSNIEKHWPCQLLLGNCFWREGFEAAFGPEQRGVLNLLLVILKNAFALFLELADVVVRACRHCACSRREITEWDRR
jgi:hypothetical protein